MAWTDYIVNGSVSKTVEDAAWTARLRVDKHWTVNFFTQAYSLHSADHNGTERRIFIGIVPGGSMVYRVANDEMNIDMVDYGWYLSRQKVQSEVISTYLSSDPAYIIEQLLGATNCGNVTGIGDYHLYTNPNWGTIGKTFQWTTETSKWDAIKEICEYTGYVFHVYWTAYGDTPIYQVAYFCAADDIDTYFNLPAQVTITNPDSQLINVNYISNQSDKINKVTVKGYDPDTTAYFTFIAIEDTVDAGEEPPIEYRYSDFSGVLDTMAKCETKAVSLYTDLNTVPWTYAATFKRRYDLQLYQKIKFSGYNGIPDDDMRITGITYNFGVNNHTVTIQCSPVTGLVVGNPEQVKRSMEPSVVSENELITNDRIRQLPTVTIGTVTDISGNLLQVNFDKEPDKTVWIQKL